MYSTPQQEDPYPRTLALNLLYALGFRPYICNTTTHTSYMWARGIDANAVLAKIRQHTVCNSGPMVPFVELTFDIEHYILLDEVYIHVRKLLL